MTDKKLIAAVVKKLERTIGILDNCLETGEISEVTRRRVVEMLNGVTLDVYYINNPHADQDSDILKAQKLLDIEGLVEVPEEGHGPASDSAADEDALAAEVAAAFDASATMEPVPELKHADAVSVTTVLDDQDQELVQEQVQEDEGLDVAPGQPEPEPLEDVKPEEEAVPVVVSEAVAERPGGSDFFGGGRDAVSALREPLLELEPSSPIININSAVDEATRAVEAAPVVDEPAIARERQQLEGLRQQLELERNRLEAELQSWQTERLKRTEEMRAAEKLLAALQAEEQRRKAAQAPAPPPAVGEHPAPVVAATGPAAQQPAAKQSVVSNTEQVTLIDKFLGGNKKFLHDMFGNDDSQTQGLTPISDLTKAIGVNDKFQFIKELFGGDSDLYTETISILNNCQSLDEVGVYLESHFDWDKNNDAVKRLALLLRRRYM